MAASEESFEGAGGLKIFFRSWRPAGAPRAVVVISHGFNSHSGQYVWVAEQFAAWDSLPVEVVFQHEPVLSDDDLVAMAGDAEIIVAMRERTAFTADRFALLPQLRLLVTTGPFTPAAASWMCEAVAVFVIPVIETIRSNLFVPTS